MNNIKELREKLKDFKVLFVDDEEAIRKTMGSFLKKFFNNVAVRTNGEEGLEAFKQNNKAFDIVITDILMPKMNGSIMVKKIKKINPEVFVILITASRDDCEFNRDLCDLYVNKPISTEDLTLILEKIENLKRK